MDFSHTIAIDYPWGKEFACQKFLKSIDRFGGKFKFKFLRFWPAFDPWKLKILSWGHWMEFFLGLLTLSYCLSLRKSIFAKKIFFFQFVFEIQLKTCFTFKAQKLKVRPKFFNFSHLQEIALDPRIILGTVTFWGF